MRLRLGDLLVDASFVTREQINTVLQIQQRDNRRLGTLLVEHGLVNETQLTQILSQQLSIPWVSLFHVDFSLRLLSLVPPAIAHKYCLIPIYIRNVRGQGDTLYVAMDDPTNTEGLQECARRSGLPTRAMIAAPSDIRHAIEIYYGSPHPTETPHTTATPTTPTERTKTSTQTSEPLSEPPVSQPPPTPPLPVLPESSRPDPSNPQSTKHHAITFHQPTQHIEPQTQRDEPPTQLDGPTTQLDDPPTQRSDPHTAPIDAQTHSHAPTSQRIEQPRQPAETNHQIHEPIVPPSPRTVPYPPTHKITHNALDDLTDNANTSRTTSVLASAQDNPTIARDAATTSERKPSVTTTTELQNEAPFTDLPDEQPRRSNQPYARRSAHPTNLRSLTLLDGTTLPIPRQHRPTKRAETVANSIASSLAESLAAAPSPPDSTPQHPEPSRPSEGTQARSQLQELLADLRAATASVQPTDPQQRFARWEIVVASAFSVLIKKGVVTKEELIDEIKSM
ncbi:MAG: hypothetical protein FWD57_00930 [Polyangiaceae bacterium]|nr:hypothetical protein [Polyangiaceae bacterium]